MFRRCYYFSAWVALSCSAATCTKAPNEGNAVVTTGQPPPLSAPAQAPRRQTLTAEARMREHFAQADVMRRGLVAGDLELAKQAAASLAGDEWSPRLAPDFRAYYGAMRDASLALAGSEDLHSATLAFAQIAGTCADCHTTVLERPLSFPAVSARQDGQVMASHAKASEQLWWGLSAPSEALWAQGAAALGRVQLSSDVPEIAALHARLVALGELAEHSPQSVRPGIYAKALQTCSACHRVAGLHLSVEANAPLATAPQ